jgi:WD40 repeat protein
MTSRTRALLILLAALLFVAALGIGADTDIARLYAESVTPSSTPSYLYPTITSQNAGRLVQIAQVMHPWIGELSWSANAKALALAASDGIFLLHPADSFTAEQRLDGSENTTRDVVFNPDGSILAYSIVDHSRDVARLADSSTGSVLHDFVAQGLVTGIAFSPDGSVVGIGEGDDLRGIPGMVRIWEVTTGKQLLVLRIGRQMVNSLAFSPDGKHLAVSCRDRVVQIWNLETEIDTLVLKGHTDLMGPVIFSPDGVILAFGDIDQDLYGDLHGVIRLWNIEQGKELSPLQTPDGEITSISFNPNGELLATGAYDGAVRIWVVASRRELYSLQAYPHGEVFVSFSPDGAFLASEGSGTMNVWAVAPY